MSEVSEETVKIRPAPIPVQALDADTMRVRNLGPSTVYYGNQAVSSVIYSGSIAPGELATGLVCGVYFVSTGRATVMVTGERDAVTGGLVTPNVIVGDYTLTAEDEGRSIQANAAGGVIVTVPAEAEVAFPVGAMVEVGRRGDGLVAIDAAEGVIFIGPGFESGVASRDLLRQYSVAVLLYCGGDEWWVTGEVIPRVEHDASTATAALFSSVGVENTTHTPAGIPRGVVVRILQATVTDEITGVTYGGQAMTRVRLEARAAGDQGAVYVYFLGTGVPTGAQTVAITSSGTSPKRSLIDTIACGDLDTAIDVETGANGAITNPTLTLGTAAETRTCIYYVMWTAANTPPKTTEEVQPGQVHQLHQDFGIEGGSWSRKEHTGGSVTIGYTFASAETAHAAIAIRKVP